MKPLSHFLTLHCFGCWILGALIVFTGPGYADADMLSSPNKKVKVQPVVAFQVHAFPLEDVRLLPGGPFKHAMDLDESIFYPLTPIGCYTTFASMPDCHPT